MATFELERRGVPSDIEGEIDTSAVDIRIQHHTAAALLFNCIVTISGLSTPEDQQKEARVLIKEVKEKLRKLRSMLAVPKK